MKRSLSIAACAAVTLLVADSPARALIIDDFNDPVGGQAASDDTVGGGPVVSSMGGLSVLGGSRELIAEKTGPGAGTDEITVSANLSGMNLGSVDQFTTIVNGIGTIIYDGTPNGMLDPMGLPGVDLTQKGQGDALLFRGLQTVGGDIDLTIDVYDATTGAPSTFMTTLPTDFTGPFSIPFASFSDVGTFTNVGAIRLTFDGTAGTAAGSDVTFASFQNNVPVPEPTSLALLGMGVLGLAGARRRRRNHVTGPAA